MEEKVDSYKTPAICRSGHKGPERHSLHCSTVYVEKSRIASRGLFTTVHSQEGRSVLAHAWRNLKREAKNPKAQYASQSASHANKHPLVRTSWRSRSAGFIIAGCSEVVIFRRVSARSTLCKQTMLNVTFHTLCIIFRIQKSALPFHCPAVSESVEIDGKASTYHEASQKVSFSRSMEATPLTLPRSPR